MTEYFERPSVDLIAALEEFGLCLDEDSESETDEDSHLGGLDQVGIIPSWQEIQITLRDVSYNFMTGLRKDAETIKALEEKESVKVDVRDVPNSLGIVEAEDAAEDVAIVRNGVGRHEGGRQDEAGAKDGRADATPGQADAGEAKPGDGREDSDEGEEEHGYEDDDDIEEIGRLPTFHQLQFTLRNASDIISSSMFGSSMFAAPELPSITKPTDLLAKWGGPLGGGGLGWYSFMQNFQLPSFLADGESDTEDIIPVDVENHPEAYSDEGISDAEKATSYNSEGLTGCAHYLRNCKTECHICKRFYVCQACHDEVETHEMDRMKVRRMLCMHCKRPQPPNRRCGFCKEIMGDYYCGTCKLWSDDPEKPIYHCEQCNICRVGRGHGIDTFHCDKCGICMALTVKDNHKCIERAANSGCPICLEDLFSSTKPTVFMPCGHPIHSFCFSEYTKRYYRCPICAKSIFDTSALFRMIDEEVRCEVLPPELANKRVRIVCQDCRLKSRTDFHLAGLKCETCGSYNTVEI